ncbi:MAG TPA: hypothetical protein VNI77_07270 [Nitrososphaera sp.]|nr:hypothetical protein [Nitrososphaera sp.]
MNIEGTGLDACAAAMKIRTRGELIHTERRERTRADPTRWAEYILIDQLGSARHLTLRGELDRELKHEGKGCEQL